MKRTGLDALLQYDNTRMKRAAAKLTHVGEQTIPVSTIVIQVYYYLPSLAVFRPLRTPGISYVNDELPVILNFSVAPDEFSWIINEASRLWEKVRESNEQPSLSFATVVDAPEGVEGSEILFSREGGVALHSALSDALDPKNGIGATVLEIQRRAAYTNT